ncbi:rod-determining factor RdfA [Haladaptatus halobius]|uniref:rod-determining factor RdfA n=1 Tax=Haladaptatus halobius TaxID=2884875 RepID=UPI001D09C517|nr:rod-determining factor RdfA [Haladaptatus halobius]
MPTENGCKVDHVIERYGLEEVNSRYASIDERLLARWIGDERHTAEGYRSLTEWFNKRLLREVFNEHGRDALGARIEHDYGLLIGDDDLLREEVTESLEADGIDADQVREDMVSWGTMRTHLLNCLNGEKEQKTSSSDWERESVEMAKSFAREKVEDALSSLASKEKIDGIETSSVSVQIQVSCDICPTRVPLEVALEQGYVCEQHIVTNTETNA